MLHCKSLEELPWSDVTPADTIRIILAGVVCAQLDRLKNDGNSRRAKRARKASSRCNEILNSKDEKVVIRQSSPKVTLELAPAAKPKTADFPDLDLSYEDDRLVAETLNFARNNPSLDVRLLTDDMGPKRTAKGQGLTYVSVPGDGWRLAPENDPRDKEIIALRQENERLRSEYALIAVNLEDENGPIRNILEIQFSRYPKLEPDQIRDLLHFADERLTAVLDLEATQSPFRRPLSHHPNAYRVEQRRAQWTQELTAFLGDLDTTQNNLRESKIFTLVVSCDGVRPAETVKVSIETSGMVQLAAAGEPIFQDREIRMPAPPDLYLSNRPGRPLMPQPAYRPPVEARFRRPDIFYRDTFNPARCNKLEYSSPELAHRGVQGKIQFYLLPASDSESGPNGSLQYTVRARNLPDPIIVRLGVSFFMVDEDTFSFAKEFIEKTICRT